ncbi:Hypothetical protein, putative [Bodo saltans]|uniref:Uncharacterized protein n=1 Tax=Bodo saltans TaxID=75058 RepID=A0A0S4IVB3_BODSA|nr:Hypothetical protein, putative [Bodo saltans]|eukprot:CUG03074.1 Hypothetical protein, putative [Bodo saltans]
MQQKQSNVTAAFVGSSNNTTTTGIPPPSSVGSASSGEKKNSCVSSVVLPSLPLQTESAITLWLYKKSEASLEAAHNSGLLSPLWLWTHLCYTDAQRVERSSVKAANLAQWLVRNRSCSGGASSNNNSSNSSGGEPPTRPSINASSITSPAHLRIAVVAPHSETLKRVQREFVGASPPPEVSFLLTQEIPAALRRREEKSDAAAPRAESPLVDATTTATNATSSAPRRVHTSYQHVIFLLPEAPTDANVALMMAQEVFLCSNLAVAATTFTVIADASWLAPSVLSAWKGWKGFVEKLSLQGIRHENLTILGSDEEGVVAPPATPPSSATSTTAHPSSTAFPTSTKFAGTGLVGPKIPVCCSTHHNQFLFFSGLQLEALGSTVAGSSSASGGTSFCKQLCKKPHHCFKPEHMCGSTCHPNHDHRQCTFACRAQLPCGHVCLMECGEPCNCLEIVTEPLPCSHQVVAGLDPVTQQPIYTRVPHTFRGFCTSKSLPCVVDVPTVCATCLGPFTAPCHQLQRQEHTMENKTVSCETCKRAEAEIRSTALAEVLVQNEQKKRDMKADLAKSVHEQRKGAASGVFKIGARIFIRDASKAIPPFDPETDFPNVPFVDYDADNFFATLNGSMGIIVSQHVDVDDPTELRSLVRLSSGKYVLVGDGGMEYIRADVSSITGGSSSSPMLLLTGPSPQQQQQHNEEEGPTSEEDLKWKAQVDAMKGKCYLLMNTVKVSRAQIRGGLEDRSSSSTKPTLSTPNATATTNVGSSPSGLDEDSNHSSDSEDAEENMISFSEVVVTVIGNDPQKRRPFIEVECVVLDRLSEVQALEESLVIEGGPLSPQKRPRDDDAPAAIATEPGARQQVPATCERFSVQVHDLDPLPFSANGADVFVTHPQYQLTSRELVDLLSHALQSSSISEDSAADDGNNNNKNTTTTIATPRPVALDTLCLMPNAIAQGEVLRVESIVNAPLFNQSDIDHGYGQVCRGPVCLLSSSGVRPAASAQQGSFRVSSSLRRGGRGAPPPRAAPMRSATSTTTAQNAVKLVLVPLAFVAADEVTNAMNRMDDEAQHRWVQLVQERLQQQFEARALRNDELAFQAQMQMPPVTDELLRQAEENAVPAVSCPTPIPTKEALKQMEARGRNLPVGAGQKMLETKDAAQRKMSLLRAKQFAQHLYQQTKDDQEAMKKYLETVGHQQQQQSRGGQTHHK